MYNKNMEMGRTLVLLLSIDTMYQRKLAGLHQASTAHVDMAR